MQAKPNGAGSQQSTDSASVIRHELEATIDSLDHLISALPADDEFRPGLITVRRALLARLGRSPLEEAQS